MKDGRFRRYSVKKTDGLSTDEDSLDGRFRRYSVKKTDGLSTDEDSLGLLFNRFFIYPDCLKNGGKKWSMREKSSMRFNPKALLISDVDIFSKMSSIKIDAIADAIKTIAKKFLVGNDNYKPNATKQVVEPNHDDPIVHDVNINTKSTSYAGAAGANHKVQPKVTSNFRPLVVDPVFEGVNISIPRKLVENINTHFEHTLYGYFIGKRISFLIVKYYARNNWIKHGVTRIMMNLKGFFFFTFDSQPGLEAVLEEGPWLIRKAPIILKKWSMDTRLLKEEVTCIPVWVKLDDVPIRVFKEMCPKKVVSPPIVSTSNVVTPTIKKNNDALENDEEEDE
nr:zinc knuckle CX2CX4HX4C [Tanacetum cinerariifolium]